MAAPPVIARDIPRVVTELVLKEFSDYLVLQREQATTNNGCSATTLEEALLPLYLLYGNTFTSAIGIALHGAERVLRCVLVDTARSDGGEVDPQQPREHDGGRAVPNRCVYMVGNHCILSPFYCNCGAYNYACINRQEAWMCKHLLALRIVLLLKGNGFTDNGICETTVTAEQFQEILQQLL